MFSRFLVLMGVFTECFCIARTSAAEKTFDEIPLKDVLIIRSASRAGRSVVHRDAIEAEIVAGRWRAPHAGEVLTGNTNDEPRWESAVVNEHGALQGSAARGGYVYWPVTSESEQIMLLEAAGYGCVYVNGEIRGGDPYGYGYVHLPVLLHKGTNDFLFQAGRGDFHAKLVSVSDVLTINTADNTLPDIIEGEAEPIWGAAVLINASTNLMHASLRVVDNGTHGQRVTIPPLGIQKTPFLLHPPRPKSTNSCTVTLEAVNLDERHTAPARAQVNLRVRRQDQVCMRTFLSQIDGSVQYYAVNPATGALKPDVQPALFLSLHGAGVEARGQAEAYSPKSWGHIVCPTNRRPYGFDWEEWGEWDALEVLQTAKAWYRPDPHRIYLTGHSMGGHGTWQLGALFPDQFAAIGPSAGWISFTSYTSGNRAPGTNALEQMLHRAAAASETLLMATNYLQEGVYILHGDADDNVPIREARKMREVLSGFHHDFQMHEQPGAGHWWDASDEPGTDCVDWAPMFDFFAHHVIPSNESLRRVRFVTVNPAISARSHWVTILAQEHSLETSAVDVRCDPGKRRVVGLTTNVSALLLEFPSITPGPDLTVELDGQKLEGLLLTNPPAKGAIAPTSRKHVPSSCLLHEAGVWKVGDALPDSAKRPERSGPFRQAFRHEVMLVYGTKGTAEENAWALAKARYDAETFYYRGNASPELIADVDLLSREREAKHASRNVVLYGNAESNAAWPLLLANSPIQVHRGRVSVGERTLEGEDLGCVFLQPHPSDAKALVGVVAGAGMTGLRVNDRLPYFLSGAGFPDCLIIGAELPAKGIEGVRAAGFFGQDWQVSTGDFAWR